MQHFSLVFCTILCLSWQSVFGIVYMNRVLNPTDADPCNFTLTGLNIDDPLTLDGSYQNDYGSCAGLEPGPPFIFESNVNVNSELVFVPAGSGNDRIELTFSMAVQNGGSLSISGYDILNNAVLSFRDTSSLFMEDCSYRTENSVGNISAITSDVEIYNTSFSTVATTLGSIGSYRKAIFQNCSFDHQSEEAFFLWRLNSPQQISDTLKILNCTFTSAGRDGHDLLEITFSNLGILQIEDCTFDGIVGRALSISNVPEIILKNNKFSNIICPTNFYKWCGTPVLLSGGAIKEISGNVADNNDFNVINTFTTGSMTVTDSAYISLDSTMAMVFEYPLFINDPSVLTLASGSVFKFGSGSNIIISGGTLNAENVVFTSINDRAYGDTTSFDDPNPGDWGGFRVGFIGDGTAGWLRLEDCVIRYGGRSTGGLIVRSRAGVLQLNKCRLASNQNAAVYTTEQTGFNFPNGDAIITNNTFVGNDIGINAFASQENSPLIRNNKFYYNDIGMSLSFTNEIGPTIHRNLVAGSNILGIDYEASGDLSAMNNIIAANDSVGVKLRQIRNPNDSLVWLNNTVVGNAKDGFLMTGSVNGQADFTNNLIAYNDGWGIFEDLTLGTNITANDLINNAFFDNGIGVLRDDKTDTLDIAGLNNLDEAANNIEAQPFFHVLDSGVVTNSFTQTTRDRFFLIDDSLNLPIDTFKFQFVQLVDGPKRMFLIHSHNSDTIRFENQDYEEFFPIGTPFRILSLTEYDSLGGIQNKGFNRSDLPGVDFVGNDRLQRSIVDIGAIESDFEGVVTSNQPDLIVGKGVILSYVNPFLDQIRLNVEGEKPGSLDLMLMDIQGKEVAQTSVRIRSGVQEVAWKVPFSLPTGIYILNVQMPEGKSEHIKLVHP